MTDDKLIIEGKKKLSGEIEVAGSKNAAFPVLVATLLTEEDCIIDNLPLIEDIYRLLEIFESMGVIIEWLGERKVRINAKNANPKKMDADLALKFRGSVLLIGALLARFGKANLPQPGGCVIGVRSIDSHLDVFNQMDVVAKKEKTKKNGRERNAYFFTIKQKKDEYFVILDEISVTATANATLLATAFKKVTIFGGDADYPNRELIKVLIKMGVKIEGIGSHQLEVFGEQKLKGFKHSIMYDPIEAGTFIVLAATTKGEILVKNVEYYYLSFFLKKLKSFGVNFEITQKGNGLVDIKMIPSKNIIIKKIQSLPFPGFPTDLLQVIGVLATQTKGQTILHDPLYEGRLKYLDALTKMGAEVFLSDPHRATINGVTKLYGQDVGSFDLRGGASLIIAGLIAEGITTISNTYQIDRGYEKIDERLNKLGANIKKVK
ncbi:MAG: UDP-N-acetylglucosamine 1-carboxyvinyltransferase [Candidatus Paceibacterota bacterium]|jgi:UDP-N-acetylglucosamine 1-carboxyvinyltransferase|nr:UDP-N-acetylglucosamine 1-carboxyvinyltransferase [bacterium]